jgi:DNA-binding NarL/FixJ family response regulator
LEVICETADGEEAVAKAEELQPELILLDILLPGISGIEAARRIRRVSRRSQIIFVSQHDSEHMARAALETGGRGYVVKSDAGRELLKAISAVRQGQVFVSQRMIDQGWVN